MNSAFRSLTAKSQRNTPAEPSSRGAFAVVAVFLFVISNRVGAAQPIFQFSKSVQSPPIEQDELLSVQLDADVYEATQEDLDDMRIVDRAGEVVPSILRPMNTTRSQTVQQTWTIATRDYLPTDFHVEQEADARLTHVFVETRREPLTTLTLEIPQQNFSRRAAVQVDDINGIQRNWRTIGEATLTRLDFKGLQREQLGIPFPETRRDQYRIVIDDRDSPPLDVIGVTAEGNVYEVVFLASPGEKFCLVYGNAEVESADYDTAAIDELLRSGFEPVMAELGPQQDYGESGADERVEWNALLKSPLMLGALILLLVIALSLSLYQAARRMEGTQPTPGDQAGE